MSLHVITADIYAHWGDRTPAYRVYVDNDLLTERDFIWPSHEIFIRENIEVDLGAGSHTINIEHINGQGSIEVKNIMVNGAASASQFTVN